MIGKHQVIVNGIGDHGWIIARAICYLQVSGGALLGSLHIILGAILEDDEGIDSESNNQDKCLLVFLRTPTM